MAFFTPEKLKRKKIEVDDSSVTCKSSEVQVRLDRIEDNYKQLDSILAELELKMASDDRLRAIDESNADDFEQTFGIKRKRKWRTSKSKKVKKTKAKRGAKNRQVSSDCSGSANPRKPR